MRLCEFLLSFCLISTYNIEHCIAFYILEDYQNFLLYVGQRTGGQDTSVALFSIGLISRSDVCVRKYSKNNSISLEKHGMTF